MKVDRLIKARKEAERFLEVSKVVQKDPREYAKCFTVPGRRSAAAKRASLDLTMALADLRKGDWA